MPLENKYKFVGNLGITLLTFVVVYIIKSYAGYVLFNYTKELVTSDMLPQDVWYFIVAKCCLFGIVLLIILINVPCFLLYLFTVYNKKKGNYYLFESLHDYLYLDLDSNEKSLFIKIQNYYSNKEFNNEKELIYKKIFTNDIIYKNDASVILKDVEEYVKNNPDRLNETKIRRAYNKIEKKLNIKLDLSLSEYALKTLSQFTGDTYHRYEDLIKLLILNKIKDEDKFVISIFIKDQAVKINFQTPVERVVGIIGKNIISNMLSIAAPGAMLFCMMLAYSNLDLFSRAFMISEVLLLIIIFVIIKLLENHKALCIFALCLAVICAVISNIINVTGDAIRNDVVINNIFKNVKEVNNYHDMIIVNNLVTDINILKQLKLNGFMITHCIDGESQLCYDKFDNLLTKSNDNSLMINNELFYLKNYKNLYLVNVNESNNAYMKDNYGRVFNLNLYGSYYILRVESNIVNKPKIIKQSKKFITSCTAVPSYGTMISLYKESEPHKKCMYYFICYYDYQY